MEAGREVREDQMDNLGVLECAIGRCEGDRGCLRECGEWRGALEREVHWRRGEEG